MIQVLFDANEEEAVKPYSNRDENRTLQQILKNNKTQEPRFYWCAMMKNLKFLIEIASNIASHR